MAPSHPQNLILITLLISLTLHPSAPATPLPAPPNPAAQFVLSACRSTSYPTLCLSSLSSYSRSINRSPTLLAHTALSLSLDAARSASAAMRSISAISPRVAGAMSDCMENVGDSIDELRDSLSEMGKLRAGEDVGYELNSIQTWVSAALTDDESCMDGFGGRAMDGRVKAAVRGRVVNVARLTSNALAFINDLVASGGGP